MACVLSCAKTPIKYYKSADWCVAGTTGCSSGTDVEYSVQFRPKKKSETPKAIFDLSDKGQAALIETYASDPKTKEKLPALLGESLSKKAKKAKTDTSRAKFSRALEFSLIGSSKLPANRLYAVVLKLDLPAEWKFVNWRDFEVKDRAIKVANIATETTSDVGFSKIPLSQFLLDEIGEAEFKATRTNKETSTRDLEFEVLEFLPILTESKATVHLRAPFPNVNVAGRYEFSVDLEVKAPCKRGIVDMTLLADSSKDSSVALRTIQYIQGTPAGRQSLQLNPLQLTAVTLESTERQLRHSNREEMTAARTAARAEPPAARRSP